MILFVQRDGNFWKVSNGYTIVSRMFCLSSSAVSAAIKYVSAKKPGEVSEIKIQRASNEYVTLWSYEQNGFPPKRIPLTKGRFSR
jgi:hypothetical protein